METSLTEVPYMLFNQKLNALKTQVQLHSSIGLSIEKEIDSIKVLFEEISRVDGSTNKTNGSTRMLIDSIRSVYGAMNRMSDSMNKTIDAITYALGVTSSVSDSTNTVSGALNKPVGAIEKTSGVTQPADGATKSNLKKIIIKEVSEKLKISFYFDNIPVRLAEILISMDKMEKMKVVDMRKLTSTSRNSITRDVAILKKLAWIKFIGGRSNGYFILTETGKNFLAEAETNNAPVDKNVAQ